MIDENSSEEDNKRQHRQLHFGNAANEPLLRLRATDE